MLRRLLGKEPQALTPAEDTACARLASSFNRLQLDESGRVETKSEVGFKACASYLKALEAAARALRLEAVPRSYRANFTINYRALLPDEARNYRVDILEASVEQYAVIWVNGDKFEFSAEAMRRAAELQLAWSDVGALLRQWDKAEDEARPVQTRLRTALVALDVSWANFEMKWISELISIEDKARGLVVKAVELEHSLQLLEEQEQDIDKRQRLPAYQDELRRLVAAVSRLNSVANVRRKGRDDLRADVLNVSVATLQRCNAAEARGQASDAHQAARILATDVVESFAAIRDYFCEVERCLERVDPHLGNNEGLVARLVDWEESWEVGARYIMDEGLLGAVCDLVQCIREAQTMAPEFTRMCEDCDVELFMVLPRLIWLRFLALPGTHAELLASLLPHRFGLAPEDPASPNSAAAPRSTAAAAPRASAPMTLLSSSPGNSPAASKGSVGKLDGELEAFKARFQQLAQQIAGLGQPADTAQKGAVWQALVRRAVAGSSDADGGLAEPARAAMEELMRELETWSMELQRHCPEDWNQCSAVLLQCLEGGAQKPKSAFAV